MSSSRDPTRLRQGLNPLATTALGPTSYHAQLNTPLSAASMASSHAQSAQTPIQPYNPQEWMPSPAVAGSERVHMMSPESQVSPPPPPPPPYSPPRSQQQRPVSGVFDHAPTSASTPPPRIPMGNAHRPSPEPQPNRSFPPPPGAAGRGGSRERRFGLPSLGRRRDRDHEANSPDLYHSMPGSRQSMGPIPFRAPEPEGVPSVPAVPQQGPPAARRAASTGAIETPTSARSRSSSQTRWEPGMPLPPPPPGPPPTGSRSQSVQPMDRNVVPIISPPTRRRAPDGVSSLGPVPPTPANWDETSAHLDQADPGHSSESMADASNPENLSASLGRIAEPAPASGLSNLNRTGAVRLDKTILQRRNESRTRHGACGSVDEGGQPRSISDIVVNNNSEGLAGRLIMGRTPRSGGRAQQDSAGLQDSRNSTPRAPGSASLPQPDTATPPFSPHPGKAGQTTNSQSVAPKALPTPPPQIRSASGSQPRHASRPPSTVATPVSKHVFVSQTPEQFATSTIERFQSFAAKEAAAPTDADRVRLFADFIVNESRVRRERYSSAIGAMGSEIFDLTRDLFRPMNNARRESGASEEWTPQSSEPNHSHRGSIGSAAGPSNSAPASANVPVSPSGGTPNNTNWNTNYMPSLSPILSMSVSDNYENGSSRGRPPSRWWESSSQGEASGRLERSKRESKYMGVPKDQWAEADETVGAQTSGESSSSAYPPEKVGWHEKSHESSCTPQPLRFSHTPAGSSPSPAPHNPGSLDVSRLVTMPPPYPRHHPAVNNSHPELASIRTSVRALTDMSPVDDAREKFTMGSSKRREELAASAAERNQALRANLQQEISSGNLGYADAAAIESHTQEEENDRKKDLEKKEYENFQNEVVLPLNDIMTDRIVRATELFDDLARHLFDNGQTDADMPQEEGDDRPELLEKLTLLKWIFEARETLHRAIYDLLSDRNSRYCEVVMTPYRLSGNADKAKSAEAFFAEDARKREHGFANEVLSRARDFRGVVEEAVERGVALQLSAFWDIAPALRRLLESIPADVEGFGVQIPAAELEENPSYRAHPLQYLFSLLLHAEKSTYQFIEADTNLLCLLHEVKEAVAHAKARMLAAEGGDEASGGEGGGGPPGAQQGEERARAMRRAEERRLTEDLKEKVRTVQDQWHSALGEAMGGVKERVGAWLLQTGGWDETLEDRGVGVV